MQRQTFKNIIFDLGGVLVDIDPERAIKSFLEVSSNSHNLDFENFINLPFFVDFETGRSDETSFFTTLADHLGTKEPNQVLIEVWNQLILGIPEPRIQLIKKLRQQYHLLILSNTNPTHIDHINKKLAHEGHEPLESLFHKAYYSFNLYCRKPDQTAFEKVVNENNLRVEETLFVDDSIINVEVARDLGIKSLHATDEQVLFDYFN